MEATGYQGGSSGEEELAAQSMNILSSLHAAMVNFHLYPPTSDIVEDSVKRAADELREALETWGNITFCETEGKLLINEFSLDERNQARANTLAFLKDLALWEVRSLTFERGIDEKELRKFLEIFSRKRSERTLEGNLGDLLREGKVTKVKVDEKIYVSVSKEQEASMLVPAEPGEEAMEALKDELFVRYLKGEAAVPDTNPQQVAEFLADRERVRAAFVSLMRGMESSGAAAVTDKARPVRDAVDRLYGLADRVGDQKLKQSLSREMALLLASVDPGTLCEILTASSPQALREPGMCRLAMSALRGEKALQLADRLVEKYLGLLAGRAGMNEREYNDLSARLNDAIADLYRVGDPACQPEIIRRLRECGLLPELARSHPQAVKDMEIYTLVCDIRSSGSLRTLEGLSDEDVIRVAGKLMDMGERDIARRIVAVASRNLESKNPAFRSRACRFLKEMHREFKERGHAPEILERSGELVDITAREADVAVKEGLVELLGVVAGDLFVADRMEEFARVSTALLELAEGGSEESIRGAARSALSMLDPWEVGKPLADWLYGDDERLGSLAARILPYIEGSLNAKEIIDRLKGEEPVNITPALAGACQAIGEPVLAAIGELMESNVREEVYLRALELLELMEGSAPLALVKNAENNPIPIVRAQAVRSMSKMSPGDPTLLPHFLHALSDGDVDVRREGARGLGTIDDPRSVEALLSIVHGKSFRGGEEHPRVQEIACLALARLGPEKALAPLCDLLRRKSFSLRRQAVHPRVKAASCYALSQIGGSEVVDLIRDYLDDPDPVLRNEARKAISELRRRGYVE